MEKLTKEEVFALKTILVEGNDKIVGIHFVCGYSGRGGSNYSSYTDEIDCVWELERFVDKTPQEDFGWYIRAIVNDVVYLTNDNGKMVTLDDKGKLDGSYEVAYDTERYWRIKPVLQK